MTKPLRDCFYACLMYSSESSGSLELDNKLFALRTHMTYWVFNTLDSQLFNYSQNYNNDFIFHSNKKIDITNKQTNSKMVIPQTSSN